jgi:hypothetical protein
VVTLVAVVTPSLEFNVIAIPDVEEESVVHSNSQYIMYVLTWLVARVHARVETDTAQPSRPDGETEEGRCSGYSSITTPL